MNLEVFKTTNYTLYLNFENLSRALLGSYNTVTKDKRGPNQYWTITVRLGKSCKDFNQKNDLR